LNADDRSVPPVPPETPAPFHIRMAAFALAMLHKTKDQKKHSFFRLWLNSQNSSHKIKTILAGYILCWLSLKGTHVIHKGIAVGFCGIG